MLLCEVDSLHKEVLVLLCEVNNQREKVLVL